MTMKLPDGYASVQHDSGTVHAIDLGELHDDRPLWRESVVCGAATGVSSDEGGHDALVARDLTCWECAAIVGLDERVVAVARDIIRVRNLLIMEETPGYRIHVRPKKYRDFDRARVNGMLTALTHLLGCPNNLSAAEEFVMRVGEADDRASEQ